MVLSNIDKNIDYFETNIIDKQDIDYETYVYKARIYNKNITFVLGQPNFDYLDNDIVYFNIYLVKNEDVVSKIGLYETQNTIYSNLLDIEGNIIIEKLNDPVLFLHAKTFIKNNYDDEHDSADFDDDKLSTDDEEADDTNDEEDETEDDDDITSNEESSVDTDNDEKINKSVIIKEQTKEESDYEMANYKKKIDDKWIVKFMKSNKYEIVDNEGGGDCFFAVLRDGLQTLDLPQYKEEDISVRSIRKKLSSNADEKLLETYKELYQSGIGGSKKSKDKLSEYKKHHNVLKKIIGGTSNISDKSKFISDAKSNLQNISRESDKSTEYASISEEFKFMKDVHTLDDLKKIIQSSTFWVDSWAISTLERLYNVKFVILSNQYFDKGEIDNVLQCGEVDKKLQDDAKEHKFFEPNYYIIADYFVDTHYKLITYDKHINKGAFKFKELPYRIKELVLEKCMTRCAGSFSIIKDFRELANCNNVELEKVDSKTESLVDESKIKSRADFDDSIVIQIYRLARDRPIADNKKNEVKNGEYYSKDMIEKFSSNSVKLNKITDWRKKLDNNWLMLKETDKLEIKENIWPSVQHFMYASRFSNIPEIYNNFTKDSAHNASKTVEDAKAFHDTILKDKTYKNKIQPESEFKKDESKLLETALLRKFTQNDHYKELLLLTGNAKINIYKAGRGGGAYEATELMVIRQKLREHLAK